MTATRDSYRAHVAKVLGLAGVQAAEEKAPALSISNPHRARARHPRRVARGRGTSPLEAHRVRQARARRRLAAVLRRRRTRDAAHRGGLAARRRQGTRRAGEAGPPRHLEGLADLPCRRPGGSGSPPGVRGGELRLLRQGARRHAGAGGALEASGGGRLASFARSGGLPRGGRHGRRRGQLYVPATSRRRPRRRLEEMVANRRRLRSAYRGAGLDGARDQGPGSGQGAERSGSASATPRNGWTTRDWRSPARPPEQRPARRASSTTTAGSRSRRSRWTGPSGA